MSRQITMVTRVCETCGKEFQVRAAVIPFGRGRFCSRPCIRLDGPPLVPLADRFWKHVGPPNANGCLPWLGSKDRFGHGKVGAGGRGVAPLQAHRAAWELKNGPIPEGMYVLHNCPSGDNPACCNPDHLFLGTQADNLADMVAKGRQSRGEGRHCAKLTEADVRAIRTRYTTGGILQSQLADEYGVTVDTVSMIIRRLTWKHIED